MCSEKQKKRDMIIMRIKTTDDLHHAERRSDSDIGRLRKVHDAVYDGRYVTQTELFMYILLNIAQKALDQQALMDQRGIDKNSAHGSVVSLQK
jgi:hypothetical protein